MSITDRYMARVFAFYIVGLLTLLVVILQMLDLLSKSDEVMAAPGASMINLAQYALLHAPQFLIKFTPFAVLIAMLLAMMQLAVGSEIIALRTTGMAPSRILKPFLLVAIAVAILHFLFAEFVGVPAKAKFSKWEEVNFSTEKTAATASREHIWYQFDDQFLSVDTANWYEDRVVLEGFSLYAIDQEGLVQKLTEAQTAIYQNAKWVLHETRILTPGTMQKPFLEQTSWASSLDPSSLLNKTIAIPALSLSELSARIKDMQTNGVPALRERTAWFARFSTSFASIIMPFLGLFVGLTVPRTGKFAAFMALGLGIGFVFFTFDNMGVALGNLGILPPFLATFFAPLAFLFGGILFMFGKEV